MAGDVAYRKSTAREYFESICVAVILALFVRTFIVQAFKIPTGSMENNLLIGDHLLVNKFVFAPTMTRAGADAAADRSDPPRRHHRLQISRRAGARLHQARHRAPGRHARAAEQARLYQRHDAERALRALPRSAGRREQRRRVRRARAVRPRHRSAGPLFHDGRQPRQFAGQPLLGLHAAGVHQGQGAVRLLLVRRGDGVGRAVSGIRWNRIFHQIH